MRMTARLWLAAVTITALAALPGPGFAQPTQPAPTIPPLPGGRPVLADRTIAVTGTGSVDAPPDQASVSLGVQVQRPTAQEAQDQSNATMTQIVTKILALGIPREKIRTTTVNISPQRQPGPGLGPITSYLATNRISIEIDDLRLVGRAIDAGVGAGANSVDSLQFGVRDPAPFQARALQLAVRNARAAADTIAAAAGITGLRVVRVEATGPIPRPRVGVPAPMAGEAPVLPGLIPISAQVWVVYGF